VDFRAVVKVGVPVASALWGEIHKVPDRSEQVDAALGDVGSHPRMRGVEVAQGAVGIAGENGNSGVLMPFAVFAAQVVLEGAIAGAEEAQLVPAARASVIAESGEIGGGDHGEVEILSQVMRNAVGAVEPGGAHGARFGVSPPIHKVIDDQRAIGLSEEFTEMRGARGCVTSADIAWALFELIILNRSALWEMAAQVGDALALAHEFDFGEAELLALG